MINCLLTTPKFLYESIWYKTIGQHWKEQPSPAPLWLGGNISATFSPSRHDPSAASKCPRILAQIRAQKEENCSTNVTLIAFSNTNI